MNLNQINERLAAIQSDIETRGDQITAEELAAYETEITDLRDQRTLIENIAQQRRQLLDSIAAGRQGAVVDTTQRGSNTQQQVPEDPRGTMEYRQAFMAYVQTGRWNDVLQRSNEVTTSSDISAVVPTTILNEVIRKMGEYGQIYRRVRKMSIPGGVQVPILSLKPTASWIGEAANAQSERQKMEANTSVTFSYYALEVKLAQSLIATLVGLPAFEAQISDLIVEAMMAKLESDIFNGNGSGKVTGILTDSRVAAGNKVNMTADDMTDWEAWKKNVFAKMPLAYKRKAVMVMASGTWEGYIDGMTDANGQPIGRVNYGITDGIQERFAGKEVIQVEDDVVKPFDSADNGDVVAAFMNLNDYAINSNLQLSMVRYVDQDTNQIIDKAILVADGKLLDTNGVILVKKSA